MTDPYDAAFDPDQLIGPDDILPEPFAPGQVLGVDDRSRLPDPHDITRHSENTLAKVRAGLLRAGLDGQNVIDAIIQMQNQGILFREAPTDPGSASDGYHTFNELYEHRRALTAALAVIGSINGDSWRSKQHHPEDGPMFDGSFIVGIELPAGTISYHYPLSAWDEFDGVPEVESAPEWDGHTAQDVVARLHDFTRVLRESARQLREQGVQVTVGPAPEKRTEEEGTE